MVMWLGSAWGLQYLQNITFNFRHFYLISDITYRHFAERKAKENLRLQNTNYTETTSALKW